MKILKILLFYCICLYLGLSNLHLADFAIRHKSHLSLLMVFIYSCNPSRFNPQSGQSRDFKKSSCPFWLVWVFSQSSLTPATDHLSWAFCAHGLKVAVTVNLV
jgi:hypothetical protein